MSSQWIQKNSRREMSKIYRYDTKGSIFQAANFRMKTIHFLTMKMMKIYSTTSLTTKRVSIKDLSAKIVSFICIAMRRKDISRLLCLPSLKGSQSIAPQTQRNSQENPISQRKTLNTKRFNTYWRLARKRETPQQRLIATRWVSSQSTAKLAM